MLLKNPSNPTSLSEWERGIGTPPEEIKKALCKVYHALPEELGLTENVYEITRRTFITTAAALPFLLNTQSFNMQTVIGNTLEGLANVNANYRAKQVNHVWYDREQLQKYIEAIEYLLITTIDNKSRRDLYKILAESQLLACAGRPSGERLTLRSLNDVLYKNYSQNRIRRMVSLF
jgi:hypothetical protein